jgi:catecholate siderophore receptor
VSADRQSVALSAYNNRTRRRNLFEQIDAVYSTSTGPVRHLVLAGAELGRQVSDNFRNTGFFEDRSTSASVAYDRPTIDTPVTFRQSATDADNRVRATVAAVFLQDQVELSPRVQLVAGLRFDRFRVEYQNNRNGDVLARTDDLISPRAGLVVKPAAPVSLYASYSVSHLPSAGDQFSSLTTVTQQVKPETFYNYEAGIKWDPVPALSMTGAMYRLDRTNTRSTDPNDPTRIVQTGAQRTRGVELGIGGRVTSAWRLTGGYAYQDAVVTEATTAARAGARVAQVPRHSFSLWNRYQVVPRLAAGVGVIHRGDTFAAIDNTVRLPGYVRVDVALDGSPTRRLRVQINVENILDATYYAHAGGNNNISPGSGRTVRLAVTTRF